MYIYTILLLLQVYLLYMQNSLLFGFSDMRSIFYEVPFIHIKNAIFYLPSRLLNNSVQ